MRVHGKSCLLVALCIGCTLSRSVLTAASVSYDGVYRVTRIDYGNGASIAYTYDAAGNRLTLVSQPPTAQAGFAYTTASSSVTIAGYAGPGGAVTIPSIVNGMPVTCIGDSAFYGNSGLTSVTIPNSVTSIGDFAFTRCATLTSAMVPATVTTIGDRAFQGCARLAAITVDPQNPAYASVDGVLFNRSQTTLIQYPGGRAGSYTVPSGVTWIGVEAFTDCAGLTEVTVPSGISSIGQNAFEFCTSLHSVTLPDSVTSIGGTAFNGCTSLASITIPDSVISIGTGAFAMCSNLTSMAIPGSVTSIGDWTFSECIRLTDITVDAANAAYSSLGGVLFDKGRTTLIQYPEGRSGSYTIPSSVTSIADRAFEWCTGLTSVAIPSGITHIGFETFCGCSSLARVAIPASVTSIADRAFIGCTGLTTAYFEGNAPSPGSDTFAGDNNATVYYLPGTTGWGAIFAGRPTALWQGPTVTGLSPSHGPAAGGNRVVITGTNLTGAAAVEFGTEMAVVTANSATQITAIAPPGTAGQTVDVRITTPDGTSADTATDDYTYTDVTPPTVVLASSAPDPTNTSPIPLTATFSEAVTGFALGDITVTNGTAGAFTGSGADYSFAVTPGGQGRVTVQIAADVCQDLAGNPNTAALPLARVYDSIAPAVTGLADDAVPARSKAWTWGGAKEAMAYRHLIDTAPAGLPTGTYSAVTTATQAGGDGVYYLHVQARDMAGNEGAVVTVHALLDNTAPVVTGLANDPGPLQAKTWTWAGIDADGVLVYRYLIDQTPAGSPSGAYGAVTSASKAAADGSWYVHVQARDRAGNESAVATVSVLLDNTAPAQPNVCGVTPVHIPTPTWTWTPGGGGNGTFRHQFGGAAGAWSETTALSFTPAAGLSDGSHTLYVQERDTAGNWSASGWCTIRINTVPPAVIGLYPNHGPAAGGNSVVITGTGFTDVTAVRFAGVDATSFAVNSATQITAIAPAGAAGQTVSVRVTTAVGASVNAAANDYAYDPPCYFAYSVHGDTITITGYTGPGGAVTIPNVIDGLPITGIGGDAFFRCTSLTSVTIPDGVTSIGEWAFGQCTRLTSITIPNSVTGIGAEAFYGCSSLTSVTLPSGVASIGDGTFYECARLASITIPFGITSIGGGAFSGCSSLTGCTIPASVTSIGEWAFSYCTELTEVLFLGDTPIVGSDVFTGDDQLTICYLPGTTGWGATLGGRPAVLLWLGPTITGLNPTHGPAAGGNRVVITGTGLTGATGVCFGAVAATSVTMDSATQITATAPAGTPGQTVDVSVTTADGTSANTAADDYTYDCILARVGAAEVAAGRGLWDLTGAYGTTVSGNDLALSLVHDTRGKLTGSATLQVNTGAAIVPVTMVVKGGVKCRGGALLLALMLREAGAAGTVSASLSFDLALNVADRQLSGPITGSLKINGVSTPITETGTLDLPPSMDGTWTLLLDLGQAGREVTGTAKLTLSNDVEHAFVARGKVGANNTAVLSLAGGPTDPAAKAIRIKTTITPLGGGRARIESFSVRWYGQALAW